MNSNIVANAKNVILNSSISKNVSKEKIDEAFNKIFVYDNKEDFLKAYGYGDYRDGRLEGFNRADGSHLGPDATTHTVIHEVLHSLSSKFNSEGHRIENGLKGDESLNFANQVNEGATDYLACKLSGEAPRNYIQGHKLFSRLEPMLVKYTKNEDVLLETYLNNDTELISDFLNRYGSKNEFENLYNNFLYFDDEKMNSMLDNIEKNLDKDLKKRDRSEKISNIFNKIKNIFSRKDTKMLPEGNANLEEVSNGGKLQDGLAEYRIENWSEVDRARFENAQIHPPINVYENSVDKNSANIEYDR